MKIAFMVKAPSKAQNGIYGLFLILLCLISHWEA
jgi:hypothetical protein